MKYLAEVYRIEGEIRDGARLAQFYAEAPASDLRLRFFLARREVPRSELARY